MSSICCEGEEQVRIQGWAREDLSGKGTTQPPPRPRAVGSNLDGSGSRQRACSVCTLETALAPLPLLPTLQWAYLARTSRSPENPGREDKRRGGRASEISHMQPWHSERDIT
jgi:hypothetical protein